ncbi:MAG TPA: site-specific integrase [Candidatus Binataceae bacterium]|nr:site-specific integrase [Candidatus Binataceae bacterium]
MTKVERLTKQMVVTAGPAPIGSEYYIRESGSGFGLRVLDSGTRSFIWEGRVKGGRNRRLTIGSWPDWTVDKARAEAAKMRADAKDRKDPSDVRTRARQVLKFSELVDWYLENYSKPHKKSWKQDEHRLRVHCKAWMARKLTEILNDDVLRLHIRLGETRGHVEANRLVQLLRAVFYAAIKAKVWVGENPAAGIKAFEEHGRERYLRPDEMVRVNDALMVETVGKWRWAAYFPLLLMTGLRRSELASLTWSAVDLEARTLRIGVTKTGNPLLLPLASQAVAILEGLPSRGGKWVFPAKSKSGHVMQPTRIWHKIRDRAGCRDVTIHSLRHSLAS